MTVKAQLKVQLLADSVLVAESDDQGLWRSVFAAIQSGKTDLTSDREQVSRSDAKPKHKRDTISHLAEYAEAIGVSEDELTGACHPQNVAPYVHLDQRYWEGLRSKTGSRGIDSIAPIALAGTLLATWFKYAQIPDGPTVQQSQEVLATIGLRDQNAARSLKNAEWLQVRNGTVQVNPARWSHAMRIVKAYCLMKSPKELLTASEQ